MCMREATLLVRRGFLRLHNYLKGIILYFQKSYHIGIIDIVVCGTVIFYTAKILYNIKDDQSSRIIYA